MSFNYRIIRHKTPNPVLRITETWYGIHEVYYDANGAINGWAEKPTSMSVSEIDEIGWMLQRMQEAATKPVLYEKDDKLLPVKE